MIENVSTVAFAENRKRAEYARFPPLRHWRFSCEICWTKASDAGKKKQDASDSNYVFCTNTNLHLIVKTDVESCLRPEFLPEKSTTRTSQSWFQYKHVLEIKLF